jgi:hypothetical protein
MMYTPYLPALRCRLAALGRRTALAVRQTTFSQIQQHLRDFIPLHLLSDEDQGPNSRQRVFSLRLTFESFIWQMLKPKTSCREVVRHVQGLLGCRARRIDGGNSAYVQARQRLPKERLEKVLGHCAQCADRRVGDQGRLRGRPVKVVDGSTTQLPDTPKNQKHYPQPSGQKPGCGFPLMRFVVLFSLSSGAILAVVLGHWHEGELRLVRSLFESLDKGDVLLGDRAYGEYLTIATLPARGVDVVARLHGARKADFRKPSKRLARNDGLFLWQKGQQQSTVLSRKEWLSVPAQITVRIIRFDTVVRRRKRRIRLVTTLLDAQLFPAEELIALYARRWNLELALRHLKTTMGMELLRCQSPQMAEKELLAYMVAYNVIRCLMAEAVALAAVQMERLSFKGTMDALRQYTHAIDRQPNKKRQRQLWQQLLSVIAQDTLPLRRYRHEPRAVKRRPKAYQLLNKPRHIFKEVLHRCRYKAPKNRALI